MIKCPPLLLEKVFKDSHIFGLLKKEHTDTRVMIEKKEETVE